MNHEDEPQFRDAMSEHRPDAGAPDAPLPLVERLREQIGTAFLGQHDVVQQILVALLAEGHVLLEGVPGLGHRRTDDEDK